MSGGVQLHIYRICSRFPKPHWHKNFEIQIWDWIQFGTTANEGTQGSLVRMTPDVVYYSWAAFDTSIWRYLNRYELNLFWKGLFWCKVSLYRAYILEKTHSTKWKAFGNKTLHLYNHSFFYVTWTGFFFNYQMPFILLSEAHNNEQ